MFTNEIHESFLQAPRAEFEKLYYADMIDTLFLTSDVPTFDMQQVVRGLLLDETRLDFMVDLAEFGVQLSTEAKYPLPFDDTFFRIGVAQGVRLGSDAILAIAYTWVPLPSGQMCAMPIGASVNPNKIKLSATSHSIGPLGGFSGNSEAVMTEYGADYITTVINRTPHVADEGQSPYFTIMSGLLTLTMVANMLLMSRETQVREEPAPFKLNKLRAKKGRPPIGDRYFIHIAQAQRRLFSDKGGGTHASPIPHWRRGHLRHMANGTIVPVVPHAVGAKGAEPSAIHKKMYDFVTRT
ncbi:MAG: hypothetical protein AB7U75_14565 [Hyphomicrobiaceae bacterium]